MKKNTYLTALALTLCVAVSAQTTTEPAPTATGLFSVSGNTQVYFATGNLQHVISTDKWYIAEHQYDILGTDNVKGGTITHDEDYGDATEGTALADTIDLYGWSSNNAKAPYGVSTSTLDADYNGDYVNWGNTIQDGHNWRVLSQTEWEYLISGRTNADNLQGAARINLNDAGTQYVNGVILLPDTWTCPDGVTFKAGYAKDYLILSYADHQTFTLSQWQLLEDEGAVFLPTGGMRNGTSIEDVLSSGYYRTSTISSVTNNATSYKVSAQSITLDYSTNSSGYSVRLVRDKGTTPTAIIPTTITTTTPTATTHKVLYHNQLLLIHNNNTYTPLGQQVK